MNRGGEPTQLLRRPKGKPCAAHSVPHNRGLGLRARRPVAYFRRRHHVVGDPGDVVLDEEDDCAPPPRPRPRAAHLVGHARGEPLRQPPDGRGSSRLAQRRGPAASHATTGRRQPMRRSRCNRADGALAGRLRAETRHGQGWPAQRRSRCHHPPAHSLRSR
eukprot:3984153-Prymnesium_polylepis.1